MVTTGIGEAYHPSSRAANTVASPPCRASSISSSPSGWFTDTTTKFGLRGRSRRSGGPHTVLQMPRCGFFPGWTAMSPAAPRSSKCRAIEDMPNPWARTSLPRRSSAASSAEGPEMTWSVLGSRSVGAKPRGAGQAQEDRRLVHRDREAEPLQPRHDLERRRTHVVGVLALERGEALDQRPRRLERHVVEQRGERGEKIGGGIGHDRTCPEERSGRDSNPR